MALHSRPQKATAHSSSPLKAGRGGLRRRIASIAASVLMAAGAMTATPSVASAGGAGAAVDLGVAPEVVQTWWANNPRCIASAQHPVPVVLVPGTWASAEDMRDIGISLHNQGYCVYALTYGIDMNSASAQFYRLTEPGKLVGATGEMMASSRQINAFIDRVLAGTVEGQRARKVDLVGHSQGATQTRLVVNERTGANIGRVVMLAPTTRGTTFNNAVVLGPNRNPVLKQIGDATVGIAGMQQMADSDFVAYLRTVPDTVPGVKYTVVVTTGDTTATPYASSFLNAGPGATVDNVIIQNVCPLPGDLPHSGLRTNPLAVQLVGNVLAGRPARCG